MQTQNDNRNRIRTTIHLLMTLILVVTARGVLAIDIKGEVLAHPAAVGEFSLTDQDGKPFNQDQLNNKWSLLYFGFTNCTRICPVHMLQLSKFYLQLQSQGIPENELPQVVFISVDPARDTPAIIKEYVHHFHSDFIGLTGDDGKIHALEHFFSAQHKANPAVNGQYQVNHSALVYLVNPHRKMVASFYPPFYIDGLVKDYLAVITSETPIVSLNQKPVSSPQQPSI